MGKRKAGAAADRARVRIAAVEELSAILRVAKTSPYTSKLSEVRFLREYFARQEMAAAVVRGTIVGFVLIRNLTRSPYTSLYYLGVDPDCRRGGVGKLLLQWVEEQSPWQQIRLGVDDTNMAAREFWLSQGFEATGFKRTRRGSVMVTMTKHLTRPGRRNLL